MHDTAYAIGRKFFEYYGRPGQIVIELGSCAVNGTLRDFCPVAAVYLGVDIAPGPGVDVHVTLGEPLPFRSEFADLVVTSSAFEHDPFFWETFLELARILKPGGVLYINAPANGAFHRYPVDCWRFYPDCGVALERYARKKGIALTLLESFIADRMSDIWDDFVAVFRKQDESNSASIRYLSDCFSCTNIHRMGEGEILRASELTEDMKRANALSAEVADLRNRLLNRETKSGVPIALPIVFMHIPKTGGSYVNEVIAQSLGRNATITHFESFPEFRLDEALSQDKAFLSGHCTLGDMQAAAVEEFVRSCGRLGVAQIEMRERHGGISRWGYPEYPKHTPKRTKCNAMPGDTPLASYCINH